MQVPFFFFANKLGYLDLSSALIVITGLFSAGVLINVSKLQFHLPALSSIRKHYQEIWGFSKFLVATSVLQWLSGNYFILIAGATLGPISVGAIRVAQNIMGILHVIFLALENVIPIKAASVYQKSDLEGLITYFKREGGKWLLIVISLIIPVAIFSPQIIKLFYGDQYDEYSWILSSYSGIYILIFIGVLLRFFIRTIEANRIIFTAYVLNTLFSLCMANYMLDNYQVQGLLIGLYSIQLITVLVMATMIKLELK
jgi:O-antigen/teichoic acid export membrane protein